MNRLALQTVPSAAEWNDWRWQLRHLITTPAEIRALLPVTDDESRGLDATPELFRIGATPYYFSLVDRANPHCPIRRQIVPTWHETRVAPAELVDPLGEDSHNPTPAIVHKYPDRVLLLAVDRCAIYCRHCNRRRLVGGDDPTTRAELEAAFDYIARARRVRDVLVSGGDPLLLSTEKIDYILSRLRAIPHVEIIRMGTRVPVVLPMRIDDELVATLRRHHPLFVNTHFNHAKEITPDARRACEKLVDAGIPVGNQAVLLRGINSSVRSMRRLSRDLLKMRVKPYYLFQGDTVVGTDHLRTPVDQGVHIIENMRGWMTGMGIPHLVIDAPGGAGKVPIGPSYIVESRDDAVVVRSYRGKRVDYPQPAERDCTVPYDDVFFADEPDDDDREGGVNDMRAPADASVAHAARSAGIVDGASGAPRPLDQRLTLAAARRVRIVIASAVDGEPHVATSRRIAAARADDLVRGLEAARAATGAARAAVAVEQRAHEVIRAVEDAIPRGAPIRIAPVPDVAGCALSTDLAVDAANIRVPAGEDPIDHGVLVVDAAALVDLDVAVRARDAAGVVARSVSIAGGVARPGVFTLPLGTSVEDAVAAAGGATCGPAWIALGDGPMTGRPLDRDDPITKATRALVVVAADSDLSRRARAPLADHLRRALSACERCAMCADVCPPRLLGGRLRPDEITRALSNARVGWDELAAAIECSSCGLCDVACPIALSPRRLVESVARAVAETAAAATATPAPPSRAPDPHPLRDSRRLSIDLVARRLGLGDHAFAPPWSPIPVSPTEVAIPLKQSLGVAARPVVAIGDRVARGQRIAEIPDGALGAAMHASIDGCVVDIGSAIAIRITSAPASP